MSRERGRGALRLLCATLLAALPAAAQTPDPLAGAQNPSPINVMEVDGGYAFELRSAGVDAGFYRVSYNGSLVRGAGTPFKNASGLDLVTPAPAGGSGDRNRLEVRVEGGTTTVGGGLFEGNGVQPITLRGLESLKLRGTALVGGLLDGKKLQLAGGLETPPVRLPLVGRTGASNWLVFGVNGQRQEASNGSAEDATVGLVTYRAFLGRAFGWRKSADPGEAAGRVAAELLRVAPTLDSARVLAASLPPAGQRTSLQQLFLDAIGETDSAATWSSVVRDMAFGDTDAVTDQPTFAVYLEGSGWRSFAGELGGARLKSLLTATGDYWFLPTRDDLFFRARYELGFERAAPTVLKDHLLLSVSLRL